MTAWLPLGVLVNLRLETTLDGTWFSLVAHPEARLSEAIKQKPNLEAFLSRFTDSHGVRLNPAVIIARADTPAHVLQSDAVTAFRDILSASVVPGERALAIRYPGQPRIHYADAFSIYPWMLDKAGKYLHATTPALWASHNVHQFRRMSSPAIPVCTLKRDDIDLPLYEALTEHWHRRFTSERPDREDIALFRSLNVANHAMMVPAGRDATLHDYGRIIVMWVSAFEILAHPGGGDEANIRVVHAMLARTNWLSESLREEVHRSCVSRTKSCDRNLPCWK